MRAPNRYEASTHDANRSITPNSSSIHLCYARHLPNNGARMDSSTLCFSSTAAGIKIHRVLPPKACGISQSKSELLRPNAPSRRSATPSKEVCMRIIPTSGVNRSRLTPRDGHPPSRLTMINPPPLCSTVNLSSLAPFAKRRCYASEDRRRSRSSAEKQARHIPWSMDKR